MEDGRRFGRGAIARALGGATLWRAGVALALGGLALMAVAALWPTRQPRHPLAEHIRLGERAGADSLRAELAGLSAPGQDLGPAVQRLVALGFSCDAPAGPSGAWHCLNRRPWRNGATWETNATIEAEGGRVATLEVRMREVPRR